MEKPKIAICAIVKNTPDYLLKEWINHHFSIGIDDIFLYIDIDSDKLYIDERVKYHRITLEEKNYYINLGNKYKVECNPGTTIQSGLYNWFLDKYRNDYDWIAPIDDDEFLDLDIYDLNKYSDETCVMLLWHAMFCKNIKCSYNLENYSHFPPLEEYIKSFSFTKPILNTKKIWKLRDIHHGDYSGVIIDLENDDISKLYLENIYSICDKDIIIQMFDKCKNYIRHYKMRSFEEWVESIVDRKYFIYETYEGVMWNRNILHFFFSNPFFRDDKTLLSEEKLREKIIEINRKDVLYNAYYPYSKLPIYNDFNEDFICIYNISINDILHENDIKDIVLKYGIDKNYIFIDYNINDIKHIYSSIVKNYILFDKNYILQYLIRYKIGYQIENNSIPDEDESLKNCINYMFENSKIDYVFVDKYKNK